MNLPNQRFGRIFAVLPTQRPGFDFGLILVGFLVEDVEFGQVFSPSTAVFPVFILPLMLHSGSGSSVGMATGYRLDFGGSNPVGSEIFRTCPDWLWGSPSLLYNGYRVLPGGKEWPGYDADPSPPSSAVVKKG